MLADEMGLGKTAQVVASLNHLSRECGVSGPFLVVAPLSTIGHWAREFEGWSGLRTLTLHGSQADRQVMMRHQWHAAADDDAKAAGRGGGGGFWFEAVVTTFETLLLEERKLRGVPWSAVVVDEAQRLKNPSCRARTTVDGLRYEQIALLTGTPIQNNASELFSLLNLIDPRKFSDAASFDDKYGGGGAKKAAALQRALAPHMLRRLKSEVLKDEIPEKEETVIPVELTAKQKAIYRALLEKNAAALSGGAADGAADGGGGGGGGRAGGGGGAAAPSLSNVFVKLRQLCNHPHLLEKADWPMPRLDDAAATARAVERMVGQSGKLVLLHKLLPRLRDEGRKLLIFSQMKRMLDLLQDYCALTHLPCERLDGSVAQKERQASIDRFQTGGRDEAFVFLLSTKAGGVGINLTAADAVILDSDWNPQNDLQGMALPPSARPTRCACGASSRPHLDRHVRPRAGKLALAEGPPRRRRIRGRRRRGRRAERRRAQQVPGAARTTSYARTRRERGGVGGLRGGERREPSRRANCCGATPVGGGGGGSEMAGRGRSSRGGGPAAATAAAAAASSRRAPLDRPRPPRTRTPSSASLAARQRESDEAQLGRGARRRGRAPWLTSRAATGATPILTTTVTAATAAAR